MRDRPRSPRPARNSAFAFALLAVLGLAGSAAATPTPGFLENFSGTSLGGWGGGATVANPGTGGANGVGDGFLRISSIGGNLGSDNTGVSYSGNWQAAGITQVRLWLNDVDTDDPLEIHFGLGISSVNFWQYNVGFLPPLHQWAEFIVDLNSANWTRIIGSGTFAQALQSVNHVLIRHDLAPYTQSPNPIAADVGVDRVLLTNATVGVDPEPTTVPRALQLAAPEPNPSRGTATFALEVFEAGTVHIEVVDIGGRIVRSGEIAVATPGHFAWSWDGRDDSGRPTPAGVYRVRAIGASGGASRALVRVQ